MYVYVRRKDSMEKEPERSIRKNNTQTPSFSKEAIQTYREKKLR